MCLIISKEIGVNIPSNKQLRFWFKTHSDGCGIMFNFNNRIHILKGAMTADDCIKLNRKMLEMIKPLKPIDVNVVYHFRQATDGSVIPSNCHPYPITDNRQSLASLDISCDSAIVHNGVIYEYSQYDAKNNTWIENNPNNLTDTQRFIEDYLVNFKTGLFNKTLHRLIGNYTESKFTILDAKLGIAYIGEFIIDCNGLKFSNHGYKTYDKPAAAVNSNACDYNRLFDDAYLHGGKYNTEYCDSCRTYKDSQSMIDDGYQFLCSDCAKTKYGNNYQEYLQ